MLKKFIFIIIPLVVLLTSCANTPVEVQDFRMGTIISQSVYGKDAQQATREVSGRLKQIEASMTINADGGEINRLNEMAGKEAVRVEAGTFSVLEKAKRYAELSGGAFDVTIGSVVKAWGIFTDHPKIPSQDEIKKLKELVGYKDLTLDTNENTAKLEKRGEVVDLGGIAKGYAGDVAIEVYKKYGVKSAYINLGGNIVVLGNKPDGSLWKIGIQNPRAENGKYVGIVNVANKAVVTSGDYERYFEKDGVRYHHIIDPATGYPADSGLLSTTIIADSSTDADALSTATFVLGLDKGMKLVESLKDVEAIFITKDKKIYTTKGVKDIFTLDDESKEYEYVEKR